MIAAPAPTARLADAQRASLTALNARQPAASELIKLPAGASPTILAP